MANVTCPKCGYTFDAKYTELHAKIAPLCDGTRTAKEIAWLVGRQSGQVKNIARKWNLPLKPSTRMEDTKDAIRCEAQKKKKYHWRKDHRCRNFAMYNIGGKKLCKFHARVAIAEKYAERIKVKPAKQCGAYSPAGFYNEGICKHPVWWKIGDQYLCTEHAGRLLIEMKKIKTILRYK